jgi:asparagine synthase (glutamine-hydrolysing)
MINSMKHRGPDGDGVCAINNIGLGCVFLKESNSAFVHTLPMTEASQRYTIVFNGKLYNYAELRDKLQVLGHDFLYQTDDELLLYAYISWGEKMLDELDGVFALAIYDREQQTLFLARDRFGVKPLYYSVIGQELIFASEIPSILSVLPTKPSANEHAIFDYLVFNRTDQTEQTFFSGIYKLQHGCCMTLDCKKIYKKDSLPIIKWYDLAKHVHGQTIQKDKEKYMRLLTRAIQKRLQGDLRWGVGLSGGLDSSAITSTIVNVLKEQEVHSISAVYGKESSADESNFIDCFQGIVPNMHYAHPNAELLYAHLDDYVRIQGEPTPTTSPFANYCVMQEAKNYVRVVLDGQGADEALAGYEYIPGLYYKTLLTHFKWITLLKELARYARLHRSMRHIKYLLFFMLPSKMRTKVRVVQRAYMNPDFVSRYQSSVIADKLYGANTMQEMLIGHFEYKLEHLLKWGDRSSMAFSMETRQPFLDKDLVEYSLKIEDGAKIHNGYTKYILREVMSGIMPERVRTRVDKKGFAVPQDEWFRTEKFQQLVMDILRSESFGKRGYVIPEEAIKLYKKHLSGEVNISKDIWKWINLELWFREFID